MSYKKVSVIGLGYIGLPTAAVFASAGVEVIGVDVNQSTVDTINRGEVHIVEPGLEEVVRNAVSNGLLKAVTKPENADAFLVAVPTPFIGKKHDPDLSFIKSAATAIAPVLKKGDLVVLESTSPVGATEQMMDWIAIERPDLTFPKHHGVESDIRVAHCPERVLPGQVLTELVENDRVIGGVSNRCSEAAVQLYKTFVNGECIITDAKTAEMAKLTENSFRDVNIAFVNELSMICEDKGVNIWELVSLANRHPRVNILNPGPGVGGHCIAVDPWFIVSGSPSKAKIIKTAREVNDSKPMWVIEKVKTLVENVKKENEEGYLVKVACMGLAFKPNIDDLRESPSLLIAKKLHLDRELSLIAVEPNIKGSEYQGIPLLNQDEAIEWADIIVFLTNHKEFAGLKPDAHIIDTCNSTGS